MNPQCEEHIFASLLAPCYSGVQQLLYLWRLNVKSKTQIQITAVFNLGILFL